MSDMLKMANVANPLQTMKKTNGEEDSEESDMEDQDEEEEEEEEDDLPDDVVLQIDSEDEAELEAQRIRLVEEEAAKTTKKAEKELQEQQQAQVSNGNEEQLEETGKPNNSSKRKGRGRPKRRASTSSQASSASIASIASLASSASLVAAQVLADEKSRRFIYSCSSCTHHYADSLILSRHFQRAHAEKPKKKRGKTKWDSLAEPLDITPPLTFDPSELGHLKPCAQLLVQGESLLQLCLACNSQFVDEVRFQEHLSQQHGYFKLLVPKDEPTDLPPQAMVTIPGALALGKSNSQLQLPIPAPETPPPEQDAKESPANTGSNDKEDLALINAMVAEIAADRVKKTSSPKVSKMIIKLPMPNKRGRKRSKPEKIRDSKDKSEKIRERKQEKPEKKKKLDKKEEQQPDFEPLTPKKSDIEAEQQQEKDVGDQQEPESAEMELQHSEKVEKNQPKLQHYR
ncbi:LOW QUALITY PROTEIN: histone acetyltransferase KAT6B [Drosophila gunungcola]|uniref:LOW QUALITY PROTEIN: histone acetyltransferase KAT6B n=1 Tax=Drosophila gunungcola TaxID=103775 RepID=UPI0022E6B114|nr:LOW QUALITY PROTEIN: histone acetyltransferase KAT6B [Drosophila gunungcola]